jgi:hypothetical protein
LVAIALAGCAGSPGAAAPDSEKARRRPDGVAIDPISAPPPARSHAASADGLVTLRTPLGVDRAIAAVEELFRKAVVEDADGLDGLFTRDAVAVTPASPNGNQGQSPSALLLWQSRFRKLDYTKLAGEPIYREEELTLSRADDGAEAVAPPSVHLAELGEGDVVVRVPILTTHVGAERLFGDEILLWLRRDGDRFRIYRVQEDFQLN